MAGIFDNRVEPKKKKEIFFYFSFCCKWNCRHAKSSRQWSGILPCFFGESRERESLPLKVFLFRFLLNRRTSKIVQFKMGKILKGAYILHGVIDRLIVMYRKMAKIIDKTVLIFIIRLDVYIFVVLFPMQFRPTTTIGDNNSSVPMCPFSRVCVTFCLYKEQRHRKTR